MKTGATDEVGMHFAQIIREMFLESLKKNTGNRDVEIWAIYLLCCSAE